MLFPTFGLKRLEKKLPSPVDRLMAQLDGPLDSISLQIVLREYYEEDHGIFDYDSAEAKRRPLALVALHPKENPSQYSKLYRTLDRYVHHQIYEKFGLNLHEFLNLPREIVERLFEISATKAASESREVEKTLKKLTDEANNK